MAARSLFQGNFSTFTEFDGEDDSSDGGGDKVGVSVMRRENTRQHLLMMALIEHICTHYLSDQHQVGKLFKSIWKELSCMGLFSPMVNLDEMSTLQSQMRDQFAQLIKGNLSKIKEPLRIVSSQQARDRVNLLFNPRLDRKGPSFNFFNMIGFHTSRYEEEFEELCSLGSGAYGSVFHVRNKLDSTEYAVKKITFDDGSPDLWVKTLREVKHLAALAHPNIIRYHNSWLEYVWPQFTHKASPWPEAPAWSSDRSDSSGSSEGVIFQASRSAHNPHHHRPINRHFSLDETSHHSRALVPRGGPHMERSLSSDNSYSVQGTSPQGNFVVLHLQMALCKTTLHSWIKARNESYEKNTAGSVYSCVNDKQNLKFLRQILKGLSHIHSQNLIHRDIKPKNLFLDADEDEELIVKIGDFGLSRPNGMFTRSPGETGDKESPVEPMTPHPGVRELTDIQHLLLTSGVGTTIYAAPEQLTQPSYNASVDIYSLGLIMFELYNPMLTQMERIDTLNALRRGNFPSQFSSHWQKQESFIKQMMSTDPLLRPTAQTLLHSELFPTKDQIIENLKKEILEKDERIRALENQLADTKKLLLTATGVCNPGSLCYQ